MADQFTVGGGTNTASDMDPYKLSSGLALATGGGSSSANGSAPSGINEYGVNYQTQPDGTVVYGVDPSANGTTSVATKPATVGGAGASGTSSTSGGSSGQSSGSGMQSFSGSYTPWTVTGDQTVAGNISSLTDPNSPLIQQARTRALEAMNARGGVNTSMAMTAADDAAYTAATPIATADAATRAKAAGYNADQLNQLNQQANSLNSAQSIAQLQANTSLATTGMNNQSAQTIAGMNNDSSQKITAMNNDSSQRIAKLNSDTQLQVQTLQNQYGTVINSNSQAAAAFNNYAQQMAAIDASTTMDANTKTQAKANLSHIYQQQLATLSSTAGLNLSSSMNFANYPGFDSSGNYVGFNADGTTKGTTSTTTTNTETTKPAQAGTL